MTTPSGPGPGQPGLIAQQDGTTVTRIWAIRNPDKLRPWATG